MGKHRAPDPDEVEPTGEPSDDYPQPESEPEHVGDVGDYPEPDGGIRVPPYVDQQPADNPAYPAEAPADSGFAGFDEYSERDEHPEDDLFRDEVENIRDADDFPDFPRRGQEPTAAPPPSPPRRWRRDLCLPARRRPMVPARCER